MSARWVIFTLVLSFYYGADGLELKGRANESAAVSVTGVNFTLNESAAASVTGVNFTLPKVNFTLNIPCVLGLVKPCGNVTLPANFSTPFGSIFVPGEEALQGEVGGADKAFQQYTVYFVGGMAGLYGLFTALSAKRRRAFVAKLKKSLAGDLHEEDPLMTEEEKKQEEEEKFDPKSEHFIAPCEIYRFMATMHPGKVGYATYGNNAFQAGICAYMQLYLPINILLSHLEKWEFYGIKSPFWWVFNAATFATKIAALASVVSLFCSKQSLMLKHTAEAAWFLLTHDEPEAEPEKPTDAKAEPSTGVAPSEPLLNKEPAEKSLEAAKEKAEATKEQAEKALEAAKEKAEAAKEEAEKEANALAKGDLSAVANLIPQPSEWMIDLNEKFWIITGMAVNIVMSYGLVLCMYVKVSTFTGDMSDIAIVTVALYFVSDLDEKVLEANPKMKKTYGKMVLAQTERNDANPIWIKKVIGIAVHILEASVPIGLAFICLFAWKGLDYHGKDVVIGGDPFAPVRSV